MGKDPTVETDFLPDKDREIEEKMERKRLEEEWKHEQERVKNEGLEITYSYWDGAGHRRCVMARAGEVSAHRRQSHIAYPLPIRVSYLRQHIHISAHVIPNPCIRPFRPRVRACVRR